MRSSIISAAIFFAFVTPSSATNIWLSASETSSTPPTDPSQIPKLRSSGTAYVWAQVNLEKTLVNWELNIHTNAPGVIEFSGVEVPNPKLGESGDPPKDIRRYEFVAEPPPALDGQSIDSFQGFTVANTDTIGLGLGPMAAELDPLYDAANDSWLIAEIDYVSAGKGRTDLFLQHVGLNNDGEGAGDIDVIFGALTDPPLNGLAGRDQNSATPEAHIVPEPSTGTLIVVGFLGLIAFRCGRCRNIHNTSSRTYWSADRSTGVVALMDEVGTPA